MKCFNSKLKLCGVVGWVKLFNHLFHLVDLVLHGNTSQQINTDTSKAIAAIKITGKALTLWTCNALLITHIEYAFEKTHKNWLTQRFNHKTRGVLIFVGSVM